MKRKILMITAIFLSLGAIRCTKEVSKVDTSNSEERVFTHHYHYQDEVFNVDLTFDKDDKMIEASGDVEKYKQLLSEEKHLPEAYLIAENDENGAEVYVFNTVEEMNKSKIAAESSFSSNEQRSCDNQANPGQGTANYTFYQDINYVNEYTNLGKWMVSYFQIGSVGGTANDKISSLAMWGTAGESVDLFEHDCFGGETRRFRSSITNLHNFYFRWIVDVVRDPVTSLFTIVEYPAGHWGDKTSSIKGWSY